MIKYEVKSYHFTPFFLYLTFFLTQKDQDLSALQSQTAASTTTIRPKLKDVNQTFSDINTNIYQINRLMYDSMIWSF